MSTVPFTGSLGVNGFGRIGRGVVRQAIEAERVHNRFLRVTAINDPFITSEQVAYALKYDTTYGTFDGEVSLIPHAVLCDRVQVVTSDKLVNIMIAIYHWKVSAQIPWQECNVAIVIDCSGQCKTRLQAMEHNVKKVIISAPVSDASIPTLVPGVNTCGVDDDQYVAHTPVLSMASCTTNCLAPLACVLDEAFGIEQGIFSTVHAVTGTFAYL
eukprot:GSChrysophyteH2.ASY1.ANO1.1517.1 assembled CDS